MTPVRVLAVASEVYPIIKTGGLGIVAITFARYLAPQMFFLSITDPDLDSDPRVKALAVVCIASLSVFNCFGELSCSFLLESIRSRIDRSFQEPYPGKFTSCLVGRWTPP